MGENSNKPIKKRNPAATKERILKAAMSEFGSKGYGGARTAVISKLAECNNRMIYHYFGGKQNLYIACLERVYTKIRSEERGLNLHKLEPFEAIERLVLFTFDHMRHNPDFVHIAGVENTQGGKFVKQLPLVADAASDLVKTIEAIVERGVGQGLFREDIDAFQLYITILSMSYLHLSNRHTLTITYGRNLADEGWLDERRKHVCDVVIAYIKLPIER